MNRTIGILWLVIVCFGPVSKTSAADDYEDSVKQLLIRGQSSDLFRFARSGGSNVHEVLLAIRKYKTPVGVARALDIYAEGELPSAFFFYEGDLELAMAVTGDEEEWDGLVSRFYIPDPCMTDGINDSRSRVLNKLIQVQNDRVMRFLGWLLYFDDERPEAYAVPAHCFHTSVAAAATMERILGELNGPIAPTEQASRRLVSKAKSWWEDHASEYGVDVSSEEFEYGVNVQGDKIVKTTGKSDGGIPVKSEDLHDSGEAPSGSSSHGFSVFWGALLVFGLLVAILYFSRKRK